MKLPLLTFNSIPTQEGFVVADIDRLISSRLLIQASSGAGKSWAIRQLAEETHGRIQQIILDSEGEFATLREQFPYLLVGGERGDIGVSPQIARSLCQLLMQTEASCIIDLYELTLSKRREFVQFFLEELINLPPSLWHPALIILDESHRFCPERGAGEAESTRSVIDLATLGRKRGYCLVAATQRLSKLHKDCAAELANKLIGRTNLDADVRRAGDDLGFDREKRESLKNLESGTFYSVGPAISANPTLIRTGSVQTTHPQPGKVLPPVPPPAGELVTLIEQLKNLEPETSETSPQETSPKAPYAAYSKEVRELKQEVARLQAQLSDRPSAEQIQAKLDRISKSLAELTEEVEELRASVATPQPVIKVEPVKKGTAVAAVAKPAISSETLEKLSNPQQAILNALADFQAMGLSAGQHGNVAVFSNQFGDTDGGRCAHSYCYSGSSW